MLRMSVEHSYLIHHYLYRSTVLLCLFSIFYVRVRVNSTNNISVAYNATDNVINNI